MSESRRNVALADTNGRSGPECRRGWFESDDTVLRYDFRAGTSSVSGRLDAIQTAGVRPGPK